MLGLVSLTILAHERVHCVSFVVMRERRIAEVLTLDFHFTIAAFQQVA